MHFAAHHQLEYNAAATKVDIGSVILIHFANATITLEKQFLVATVIWTKKAVIMNMKAALY